MSNYTINSKNRKFKKQILSFFERINFGAGKLPFSWRIILFMLWILSISLFLPWLHFKYIEWSEELYFAFSSYTGYMGYGILLSDLLIPFFLLSHGKKERIRAYVPFRLSDAQAIVFVTSMIFTACIHLYFIAFAFVKTADVQLGSWFLIALSSLVGLIFATFFFSKNTKEQAIEMHYLDHHDVFEMDEYKKILSPVGNLQQNKGDSNMSLPI
jgi:hypothetical protein